MHAPSSACTETQTFFEAHGFDIASQLITSVFIIGGWVVVHELTRRRDRHKEHLELVKLTIERIEAARDASIAYVTRAPSEGDVSDSAKIRLLVNDIGMLLDVIKRRSARFNFDTKLKLFRQTVTAEKFDPRGRVVAAHDSDDVRLIHWVAWDLTLALRSLAP